MAPKYVLYETHNSHIKLWEANEVIAYQEYWGQGERCCNSFVLLVVNCHRSPVCHFENITIPSLQQFVPGRFSHGLVQDHDNVTWDFGPRLLIHVSHNYYYDSIAPYRLDLLPFYSRLVATLYPCMPDIATDLVEKLKQDFRWHVSTNTEGKLLK